MDQQDRRSAIPHGLEYAVFPIVALRRTGEGPVGPVSANPHVQGTAVILSPSGIFCTAGHCVNVAFGAADITGQQAHDPRDYALFVFNSRQRVFKIAMVTEFSISAEFDLAIGRAELPGPDSAYPTSLGIGTSRVGAGSAVFGIGYPETAIEDDDVGGVLKMSFLPRRYDGQIDRWQEKLVPWFQAEKADGYVHTVKTPPGFSGGPLIRKRTGLVHGFMAGGWGALGGLNFAIDASLIACGWKVPILGDITLREYAARNQSEGLVIR